MSDSLKQAFLRTYTIFLIASVVAISWISLSGMQEGADTFLIAAGAFVIIVYPLFFVPPLILFFLIKRNLHPKYSAISLISIPFLWTGFEYIFSLSQISFPWLFAGYTQTYNLEKIQYIDYTGIFGTSFWICLISVLLFYLFYNLNKKREELITLKNIMLTLAIIILYFLPDLYTYGYNFKNKFTDYNSDGTVKVGIIQPNINPWKKWGGKQMDLILGYKKLISELYSANPDVKLIVLPETALPYYFREEIFEDKYEILKNLCDSLNLTFLIGTPDLKIYENQSEAPNDAKIMKSSGLKYDTYNSAYLFEPGKDKNSYQNHDKIKLVTGSERMPYQEVFPFTKDLVEWGVGLGNWQIGKDTNLFDLTNQYKFHTAICYESVYPEFYADFVNRGADFSVIITNDGWWGKLFGTYQHNQFAIPRAIENRRWIVRCANTGISDFIDPFGNKFKETKIDELTSIVYDIGIRKEKTFYTIHGDLFSRICFAGGLIFFIISFLFRKNRIEI